MPTEPAIACSLSAGDRAIRGAQIAQLGRRSLRDAHLADRRATLRFAPGEDVAEGVAAIVAAEAECCAFLNMAVERDDEAVVLTIDAPSGAEPVLQQLVEAFRDGDGVC